MKMDKDFNYLNKQNCGYYKNGLKLKISYNKGWIFVDQYNYYIKDIVIAQWANIELVDYREVAARFGGKIIKNDPDKMHFTFKSDLANVMDWLNSIRIANKLKG